MRRARRGIASAAVLAGLALLLCLPGGLVNGSPSVHVAPLPARTLARVPAAVAVVPLPAVGRPSGSVPALEWGLAFIYYGPGDDSTHFMGEGSAMVIDDRTRNITTFGGEGEGGLINYTMDYNSTQGSFNVSVLRPTPSARTNASFAAVPGHDFAVLFGGITSLSSHRAANDTWVYYFTNQTWRNVTQSLAPPARESAAFAVNSSGNDALLEGGWNPDADLGGSTATVFWNDTWTLNLTTFNWSKSANLTRSPPPLYGSGMIWQNATHAFDLFGGCALTCTNGLWQYSGHPARWTKLPDTGGPTARASGAFVWDQANGLAFLDGGFVWSSNGSTALADSWFWDPATDGWTDLDLPLGPGPVYDAPSVWADYPGCVGFVTMGGNGALAGPPTTASVLEPLGTPQPNCYPDLISGNSSPPPPPCSGNHSSLSLHVIDDLTGLGIPNATVDVDGACLKQPESANRFGFLNITLPAPDLVNFTGTAGDYHSNRIQHEFLPKASYDLVLPLSPDPSLHVTAWNLSANDSRTPLAGVTVQEASFLDLGTTNGSGQLFVPSLAASPGNLTLYGFLANHSRGMATVEVPESGPVSANLTLDAAGPLRLEVRNTRTDAPIPDASGTLTNLDPGAPRPSTFTTSPEGWFNLSVLEAANYSATALAPGFTANATSFFHAWITPQTVFVNLTPLGGATVDARVRSTATLVPIPGAHVSLGTFGSANATTLGWANFTNILPVGPYEIIATAPGFATNYSWVELGYEQVLDPYPILMQPLVGCGPPGSIPLPGECVSGNGSGPGPFGFLPGGPGAVLLVTAAPLALLVAGVAYAWLVSRRPAPSRSGRPVSVRGTP
jgi:hypothetical protein